MSAGQKDITIEQGALFEMLVTVKDNQSPAQPVDLTGFVFEGQIRASQEASTANATFSFDVKDQSNPLTKGQVRVFISSSVTELIPVKGKNVGERAQAIYLYDISYGQPAGEKYRLLQGKATVVGEVTR